MTPNVTLRTSPMPNDWGYKGPGSFNPFFHPTGIAPDYNFVPDFVGWFDAVAVYNITTGEVNHYVNPKQTASPAGAEEALRLVQMFVPAATLEFVRGEEAGIYWADKLTASVVLPEGRRINAAGIVNRYYHGGRGVSADSDLDLMAELGVAPYSEPEPEPVPPPELPKPAPMPDGIGFLGQATFFPGVFELEPGDNNPVGTVKVAPNGKKYERLPTTWKEVR